MFWVAFLLTLLACGETDLVSVPGTTVRVAPPRSSGQGKQALELHIFHTAEECYAAVKAADVPFCLPFMPRL